MAAYSVEDEKTVHSWVVDNFSTLTQANYKIVSNFVPKKKPRVSFQIELYPTGIQNFWSGFTFAFVWIASGIEAKYNCRLSIMKSNDVPWAVVDGLVIRKFFDGESSNLLNPEIKIYRPNILKAKEQVLPNDKLTIRCEVWEYVEPDICRIPKDFGHLIDDPVFSDMVCEVQSKKFSLHKNILAAESSVFKAMFTNDLEEAKSGKLKVPDISAEAFEAAVKFMYSGIIPDLQKFGLELFEFADKYQMDQLKNICEKSLGTNIDTESVVTTLLLADLHSAAQLKLKCINFIKTNFSTIQQQVLLQEQWSELKKNQNLLLELYNIIDLTVETVIDALVLADSKKDSALKEKCFKFFKAHSSDVDKQDAMKALEKEKPKLMIELLRQLIP